VLVGLLTNVDRVAGAIPIVGYVFGGSMTALPVSVTGDIRNPLVGAARTRGPSPTAARHLRADPQTARASSSSGRGNQTAAK
jgi:hypothetical protein